MTTAPLVVRRPAVTDALIARIEDRVIVHELGRRLDDATVEVTADPSDGDHDGVVVRADDLFGDDVPPLAALFWRTLDPAAVDVRQRMLAHIGLLLPRHADDEAIERLTPLALSPTDLWILVNAPRTVRLRDDYAALRSDDPRWVDASAALDAAFDRLAGDVSGAPVARSAATADEPPAIIPSSTAATPLPAVLITSSPAPVVDVRAESEPVVSFVLVTYGTDRIVVDALASLAATVPIPFEVIVVDHPHPVAIGRARRHLLLDTSGVTVVSPSTNLGFGGGCELGILHTRADVIGLVNPDVVVADGWIQPLLEALTEDDTSVVSPVLLDADGSVQEAGQRFSRTGWTHPMLARGHGLADVDFASGACWLFRRDAHERAGGFDPAYHPAYFEDADLALRHRASGGRVVVHHDVAVVHRRGRSTPDAPTNLAQHRRFVERWGPRFTPIA